MIQQISKSEVYFLSTKTCYDLRCFIAIDCWFFYAKKEIMMADRFEFDEDVGELR